MTDDKLKNGYDVVFEDIIENVFITLVLAFIIDNKKPTFDKVIIITGVTAFYWVFIYSFLRPLYKY